MALVKDLEALLPQTQCRECGYPGCLPYAEALAQGKAAINQCPPGGVAVVKALARVLHLDASVYLKEAQAKTRPPSVAVIREEECIGCTKCIQACPVDAIIGSAKVMHAVIGQECTGCGLCVEPCPVDCIEMQELPEARYVPALARERYHAKEARRLRALQEQQQSYRSNSQLTAQSSNTLEDKRAKQDYIRLALARVAAKKPVVRSDEPSEG